MNDLHYIIDRYKKWLIISLIIMIIATIIGVTVSWIIEINHRQGKLPVKIKIIPSSAKVMIDNQQIKITNGDVYLTPGNHTIEVSQDGFNTIKNNFDVQDWHTPGQYIGLTPESEEAKKWYNKNLRLYKDIELATYNESQDYGKKFNERWPIVNSLPIKDPYFTISYRTVQETGDIYLTIKGTSPRYRMFAINHLRSLGFEPTDYKIEFIGFDNPLKEEASDE